jgi:hypothetical protein
MLEGDQDICDAEFMAKAVATIVCVDRPGKTTVFDSKSSGQVGADTTKSQGGSKM